MEAHAMLVDQIWLDAPTPALRLGPLRDAWRVNQAAHAWAERHGLTSARWGDISAELRAALPTSRRGQLPQVGLGWRAVEFMEG